MARLDVAYSYNILCDLEKDAWNWYDACNQARSPHGVDWAQRIEGELADKIVGKTKEDADAFLLPYLQDRWAHDEAVKRGEEFIRRRFELYFDQACRKLVELTGRPLYRNDFTIYLTTFPRGPYRYEQGALWQCVLWVNPIAGFMHEVLHFQFIHYWRDDASSRVSELSDDEFEILKESLTVILDSELSPLVERPDKGYEPHQQYREKLHRFWLQRKDFGLLVKYGVDLVTERVNSR